MADSSARVTNFTPDRAGVYVAQLVVSDGDLDIEPGAIQIQAFTVQTEAIAALQGLEVGIAALDSGAFKNGDMQNLLLNKLNAVIANVEAGKNADAANQLRNDVLPKMGSVESPEGDGIAWLIDRSSQRVWYPGGAGCCECVGNGTVVVNMRYSSQPGVSNNLYGYLI